MKAADDDDLERCQSVLNYRFHKLQLLRSALTHSSGAEHPLASNERLEFLGDSILGMIVCDLLFEKFPTYQEGELTRVKSVVVSRQTCAKLSRKLGLEQFLIVGKGMGNAAQVPASTLSNVFESIVGAIYLDGGLDVARGFVIPHLEPEIEATNQGISGENYKSRLQQLAQRQFGTTPTYHLLDEKGPDHQKCFQISAYIGSVQYKPAWGMNKKDAEQSAALNALSEILGRSKILPVE